MVVYCFGAAVSELDDDGARTVVERGGGAVDEADAGLGTLRELGGDVDEEFLLGELGVGGQGAGAGGAADGLGGGAGEEYLVGGGGEVGEAVFEEVVRCGYATVGSAEDEDGLGVCWGGGLCHSSRWG